MPLNKWNRSGSRVELGEGDLPSRFDGRTHNLQTYSPRDTHPRPPGPANIDMGRSETEWALTDKHLPGSFTTSGEMPSPGVVYERGTLPIRTMSKVQLTHNSEGPGVVSRSSARQIQTMYQTTNNTYNDDAGYARTRFLTEPVNTRCNWNRTGSKVQIGGGSAEKAAEGSHMLTHGTATFTDYPQELYYTAANGHGRHPPPSALPTVDLGHHQHGVVIGGHGNGGPDYVSPARNFKSIGTRQAAGEEFTSHNQTAYANPGNEALAHAFVPKQHIRGNGEWRNHHNEDGSMDLDRIGAAALRLASSTDAMGESYMHRTASLAKAAVDAHGPAAARRFMWDRTAATVPLKGGDGADTLRMPHYRAVHAGGQLPRGEAKVIRRGTVDKYLSEVVMKSPAAGTANVLGSSHHNDTYCGHTGAQIPYKTILPVRNTSTVPMTSAVTADFYKGKSDYQGTFGRPGRRDYERKRMTNVGLGTMSRVSLAHDARTVY